MDDRQTEGVISLAAVASGASAVPAGPGAYVMVAVSDTGTATDGETIHLLDKPYRRQDLAAKVREVLDGGGRG